MSILAIGDFQINDERLDSFVKNDRSSKTPWRARDLTQARALLRTFRFDVVTVVSLSDESSVRSLLDEVGVEAEIIVLTSSKNQMTAIDNQLLPLSSHAY